MRPEKLPSWTDGDEASKVVEPGTTKKAAGFLYKERMPFQYLNWLFRHFVKWVLHIDESVNQFDPYASLVNDEFINVTAGRINSGSTVIEQAVQQIDYTSFIPTTSATSRIDRIVIDNITGVIERIAGTEAGSPTVPSIPENKIPVCQVLIDENTTVITTSSITDERSITNITRHDLVAANHYRAGGMQLYDGSSALVDALFSSFDGASTESAWNQVGPTGSAVEWTVLDNVPSNATAIIMNITGFVETVGTGSGILQISAASEETSVPNTALTLIMNLTYDPNSTTASSTQTNQVIVPIDSNKRFQIYWVGSGDSNLDITLLYIGFITD